MLYLVDYLFACTNDIKPLTNKLQQISCFFIAHAFPGFHPQIIELSVSWGFCLRFSSFQDVKCTSDRVMIQVTEVAVCCRPLSCCVFQKLVFVSWILKAHVLHLQMLIWFSDFSCWRYLIFLTLLFGGLFVMLCIVVFRVLFIFFALTSLSV